MDETAGCVSPSRVVINPRDVEFDFSETPLHWVPGEPVASMFANTFHTLLPVAEEWECATLYEALPYIEDAQLRADLHGFAGQEAMHSKSHDVALRQYLTRNGINADQIIAEARHLLYTVAGPKGPTGSRRYYKSLVDRLWLIAILEHYLAYFGDFLLNAPFEELRADPEMTDLFRWHGAEEVEHRCVAHDVATYFRDGYIQRLKAVAIYVPVVVLYIERFAMKVLRQDPLCPQSRIGFYWAYYRAVRKGALPSVGNLVKGTLSYCRKDFSPTSVGSTPQAVAYLASSPAVRRATEKMLAEQARNIADQ